MSSFPKLFSTYKKAVGVFSTADFDAWQAYSSYAAKEPDGMMDYKGSDVKAIPWKSAPKGEPPLSQYFKELATHIWVKAKVNTSAPRSGLMMGDHRNPHQGAMPPLPPAPFAGSKLPPPPPPLVQRHLPPPPPGARAGIPAGNPFAPNAPYRSVPAPIDMQAVMKAKQADPSKPDLSYLSGIATDWALMAELEWVSAYTFRGDKRNPDQVKTARGFFPPCTRSDDYYIKEKMYGCFKNYMKARWQIDLANVDGAKNADQFLALVKGATKGNENVFYQYMAWRAIVKSEELHLGRMLADEVLKGYISTSRAVTVAKGFAGSKGWVYVVRVSGGIVVPGRGGDHAWTKVFGEQEIAYPGALSWDAVVGFRQMNGLKFAVGQPLYLRKSLQKEDPKAFDTCYELLSGKPQ